MYQPFLGMTPLIVKKWSGIRISMRRGKMKKAGAAFWPRRPWSKPSDRVDYPTRRLLVTEKDSGVERAANSASCRSIFEPTAPSSVTLPFFTMM